MARDHYVMKCHLDKFVHPSSRRKVFYPYRKGVGLLPKHRNGIGPKGLGWAENFYSQELPDGTICRKVDQGLKYSEERFFSSGKRTLSTLSRCIYDQEFFPRTERERMDIAYCASFTYSRSPVQIHNTAMMRNLAVNLDAFNQIQSNNTDQIQHYMEMEKISAEEARKRITEAKEQILKGELIVGVDKQFEKQDGFHVFHFEEVLPIMIKMRWRLVEAAQDRFFLTSDNPVAVEDSTQPSKRLHGIRQSVYIQVWYPISCRHGFLMDWSPREPERREKLGHSLTRALNRRIIKWSYRHVYSPLREGWIDEAVKTGAFRPLFDRLTSIQDLTDSTSSNIVSLLWALEHGEKADVFADMVLH